MTITIDVTAEDIEQGDSKCASCPVARALQRATGDDWTAHHDGLARRMPPDGRRESFLAPPELLRFIQKFDRGRNVQPTSFTFDLVPG